MELTVSGGLPAAPVMPTPDEAAAPAVPAPQQWQGQPQPWQPPQQWQGQPQPWPPQLPAGYGQPMTGSAPTWAAASATSAAPAVAVVKRKSGRSRAVDILFGLSMLVAVGGVAFAVGRATAPTSTASNTARGGLGSFPGQGTGRTGPNAVVLPLASGAPNAIGQQAAPSGAPVIPSPGTGTGSGTGSGTGTRAGTDNGGFQGGPPGAFGRGGGLTGTVAAVGEGTLSFTTPEGQTTGVITTDTTTYHQQATAAAADVTVGSSVRITPAGGFGGGGGAPSISAADVEILLPTQGAASATTGQGAGGGQGRGFGRGGLTGTVSALGDGSIGITTANGQTLDVTTTEATTYHRQEGATADAVTVGSSIRITAAGGFGGPGQGQGPGQGAGPAASAGPGAGPAASAAPGAGAVTPAITASDVEVLLPSGG